MLLPSITRCSLNNINRPNRLLEDLTYCFLFYLDCFILSSVEPYHLSYIVSVATEAVYQQRPTGWKGWTFSENFSFSCSSFSFSFSELVCSLIKGRKWLKMKEIRSPDDSVCIEYLINSAFLNLSTIVQISLGKIRYVKSVPSIFLYCMTAIRDWLAVTIVTKWSQRLYLGNCLLLLLVFESKVQLYSCWFPLAAVFY